MTKDLKKIELITCTNKFYYEFSENWILDFDESAHLPAK